MRIVILNRIAVGFDCFSTACYEKRSYLKVGGSTRIKKSWKVSEGKEILGLNNSNFIRFNYN
ncbi:hypothetical protein DRP07_10500 [Archaeoglobales archaeon]|nr:MAG: hypothetical protein DRP07_10500 [Archaeoglobales archaeon]